MATLQVLGSDKAIRINDYNLIGLVQNLEWTPNFNAQDVQELGNTARLATETELEVTGSFEVLASGALPNILARMAVKRNATTDAFEGFVYASGGAGGKNAYTFTESDISEMIFDLIEHERTDQQTFNRSVILPRMFLTGISCRVDANGRGSTTINFAGDYVYGAPAPYHDHRSVYATYTTGTTATAYVGALTGYSIAYVYVNEKRFSTDTSEPTYVTFVAATGVVTFVTTEGFTIVATDVIKFLIYKSTSPSTIFPGLALGERATTSFFTKGWGASLYIAPADMAAVTAPEQWFRAQTIDWNVDLRVEALRQIAYNRLKSAVYARVPTNPFEISLNASVIESDWADWKAVIDQSFPGNDWLEDNYNLARLKGTFAIVVKYFTPDGTLLTEWRFRDMRVDGMGSRVQIGGRGEISWSFRGNAFTLIGYNG